MPLTFKSKATGDVLMLNAHAQALLQVLGKPPTGPGILQVPDMPLALALLRGLPDEPLAGEADAAAADDAPAHADDGVSLRKRAWPLIQMIEEAQAAGEPVVWGV